MTKKKLWARRRNSFVFITDCQPRYDNHGCTTNPVSRVRAEISDEEPFFAKLFQWIDDEQFSFHELAFKTASRPFDPAPFSIGGTLSDFVIVSNSIENSSCSVKITLELESHQPQELIWGVCSQWGWYLKLNSEKPYWRLEHVQRYIYV